MCSDVSVKLSIDGRYTGLNANSIILSPFGYTCVSTRNDSNSG